MLSTIISKLENVQGHCIITGGLLHTKTDEMFGKYQQKLKQLFITQTKFC